jgi:hypothetical protein
MLSLKGRTVSCIECRVGKASHHESGEVVPVHLQVPVDSQILWVDCSLWRKGTCTFVKCSSLGVGTCPIHDRRQPDFHARGWRLGVRPS